MQKIAILVLLSCFALHSNLLSMFSDQTLKESFKEITVFSDLSKTINDYHFSKSKEDESTAKEETQPKSAITSTQENPKSEEIPKKQELINIEDKQEIVQNKQIRLSKMDKIKLGTAAFGFAWFSTAAAITYPAKNKKLPIGLDFLEYSHVPVWFPLMLIAERLNYDTKNNRIRNKLVNTSGLLCGTIAVGFGLYIYRKLSKLKQHSLLSQKNNN